MSAEEQIILEMLQRMSPLEKAGQLMLVTFDGTDVSENSEIIELIQDYHIGGVVLSTKNENFTDVDTAQATQALITALQESAYQKSLGLPATG
ncbi:MAG TPA: glycoside hydrolase family 3 N-terminal domain-containing protein, partial [Anaerolineaceae bacterium]|nr:glycoside hydrolase family 3 N-terminal domain-containing protein [Anaerolineaceae bacterium]